ncbi:MAG: BMP family ABC transporter substrate-binding protein [Lachnospiraceae bacterium]|nr:BMP family ABC transporter substrate-binding protein [Lachnospiraceae bacterium]
MKSIKLSPLILCALCIFILTLSGCGGKVDIAFITDMGTVSDGSFNQGSYEGALNYAENNDKQIKVYEPQGASNSDYLKEIRSAVKDGAKVVVCAGTLFEESIYTAQKKYPKVDFILVDGIPHDDKGKDFTIKDNTMPIMFSEEEAGFLAGYAAVRDGNTELGFVGGTNQESVEQFGYGYVQGADYAAIEMGVNVRVKYCYANTFLEDDNVKNMAEAWYNGGTQIIFACGGAMGRSVIAAAEESGGKIIGVDIDQSRISETVVTSAKKMLGNAVYMGLEKKFSENFTGGAVYEMEAENNGIGLEMENSRFEKFDEELYNAIYEQLASGRIEPYSSTDFGNTSDLELVNTEVFYLELNND